KRLQKTLYIKHRTSYIKHRTSPISITLHNPTGVVAIFPLPLMAYFFFVHNLLPGLLRFFQFLNIYFPGWQNTSHKQRAQDSSPAILSKLCRHFQSHSTIETIYISLYDQDRQDIRE